MHTCRTRHGLHCFRTLGHGPHTNCLSNIAVFVTATLFHAVSQLLDILSFIFGASYCILLIHHVQFNGRTLKKSCYADAKQSALEIGTSLFVCFFFFFLHGSRK